MPPVGSEWGVNAKDVVIDNDPLIATDPSHRDATDPDSPNGRVYVYEREGAAWNETDQLVSPDVDDVQFGWTVDMSAGLLVATSRYEIKAYLYRQADNGEWQHVETLQADASSDPAYNYAVVHDVSEEYFVLAEDDGVAVYDRSDFFPDERDNNSDNDNGDSGHTDDIDDEGSAGAAGSDDGDGGTSDANSDDGDENNGANSDGDGDETAGGDTGNEPGATDTGGGSGGGAIAWFFTLLFPLLAKRRHHSLRAYLKSK